MYNGTGLHTPRGSVTNGSVQSNKFFAKPNTNKISDESGRTSAGAARKPDPEIMEHDRKRQIELKLLVLEEKMIDHGYTDAQIAVKIDEARKEIDSVVLLEK